MKNRLLAHVFTLSADFEGSKGGDPVKKRCGIAMPQIRPPLRGQGRTH